MLGFLLAARPWPVLTQPGDIDNVGAEAAASPIALRNSLLVCLSIHLPLIQFLPRVQKTNFAHPTQFLTVFTEYESILCRADSVNDGKLV